MSPADPNLLGRRQFLRRALQAGASQEEILHALLLLVSTIGFPQTMAAISWSQEVLEKKPKTKEK